MLNRGLPGQLSPVERDHNRRGYLDEDPLGALGGFTLRERLITVAFVLSLMPRRRQLAVGRRGKQVKVVPSEPVLVHECGAAPKEVREKQRRQQQPESQRTDSARLHGLLLEVLRLHPIDVSTRPGGRIASAAVYSGSFVAPRRRVSGFVMVRAIRESAERSNLPRIALVARAVTLVGLDVVTTRRSVGVLAVLVVLVVSVGGFPSSRRRGKESSVVA